MRYKLLIMLIILSTYLSACSIQNVHDIDTARQVAVDTILEDDTYKQYDGYEFKELIAESSTCDTCYHFVYTFNIPEEYLPGIKGYMVDVTVKNNIVEEIRYNELNTESSTDEIISYIAPSNDVYHSTPIPDRFDEFCDNKCGDGFCNDIVCQDKGCVCEENKSNCPEDC